MLVSGSDDINQTSLERMDPTVWDLCTVWHTLSGNSKLAGRKANAIANLEG